MRTVRDHKNHVPLPHRRKHWCGGAGVIELILVESAEDDNTGCGDDGPDKERELPPFAFAGTLAHGGGRGCLAVREERLVGAGAFVVAAGARGGGHGWVSWGSGRSDEREGERVFGLWRSLCMGVVVIPVGELSRTGPWRSARSADMYQGSVGGSVGRWPMVR